MSARTSQAWTPALLKASRIIQQAYDLQRAVTYQETVDEIASLKRKHAKGTLDSIGERMFHAIDPS